MPCLCRCFLINCPHCFLLQGIGKYGVLFYNALFIVIPTTSASLLTGDLHKVHSTMYIFLLCVFDCSVLDDSVIIDLTTFWSSGSDLRGLGQCDICSVFSHVLLHGVCHWSVSCLGLLLIIRYQRTVS